MLTSSDLFMSGLGNRSCGQARCMLFRLLVLVALICTAFVLQPAALQAAEDEYPHCISHLWAAGSQLGWAEAIARHDAQSEDARMLEHMHDAGLHVERANELCAQDPAPWPAWPNWREIQHQLTGMADQFHDGRMNRERLAIAIAGAFQSLATQLAFRVLHTHLERDATCVEIYVRLGAAVGFAQTTTQIFHRLAPDAAVSLRRALSLIYQMREMPQPCRDFKGLIPAIGEALNSPNDPSIVGRVDDIWHAGQIAAAPRTE
jgi:hypothetical protein